MGLHAFSVVMCVLDMRGCMESTTGESILSNGQHFL